MTMRPAHLECGGAFHMETTMEFVRKRPPRLADAGTVPPAPAALLCGYQAIAAHIGMSAADVEWLDVARRLPTYQRDGCIVASSAALDHWKTTRGDS